MLMIGKDRTNIYIQEAIEMAIAKNIIGLIEYCRDLKKIYGLNI